MNTDIKSTSMKLDGCPNGLSLVLIIFKRLGLPKTYYSPDEACRENEGFTGKSC